MGDTGELTAVTASEATAERLCQAIDQLDTVINGIFALIIELEQRGRS